MYRYPSRNQFIFVLILLSFIVAISYYPNLVERYYSMGIYPYIGVTMRSLTRWFPFSIGDIIYIVLVLKLVQILIKIVILLIKTQWRLCLVILMRYTYYFLWLIILFYALWGLNYSRLGITYQMTITPVKNYTYQDLQGLRNQIALKLNNLASALYPDSTNTLRVALWETIKCDIDNSYKTASTRHPFLRYSVPCIKPDLFEKYADYFGYTGYNSPLTGEAQVRQNIPRLTIPYTMAHEIAHQIGYASEDEANFVAYLVSIESPNLYLQYSCYIEIYRYVSIALLYDHDSIKNSKQSIPLNKRVIKDLQDIDNFLRLHNQVLAIYMMNIYDEYLKANKQTKGINSYNEVIGLLMAYHRRYGYR
ncbi:MAG: DUF3810 domain-containing protein [Phycisphaerales bacterium]|nr:DUF3810 domain-containing protein [Phycisphaerales bacterium]